MPTIDVPGGIIQTVTATGHNVDPNMLPILAAGVVFIVISLVIGIRKKIKLKRQKLQENLK